MNQRLANLVSHHPRWVLAAWLVLTLAALPFAARVGSVLTAQPGQSPSSAAAQVKDQLVASFSHQDPYSLVLLSHSEEAQVGTAAFDAVYRRVIGAIRKLPAVADIQDYRNTKALPLVSPDRHEMVSLIGLQAPNLAAAKQVVGNIRKVLDKAQGLTFNLSGGPALSRELERISERDTQRVELFGLPLSLLVLIVAFGAIIASGLPLLVAVMSVIISSALLFLLGQWLDFAVFTQSIVTMLGLATGIDYALLMVNRFREELHHADARQAAATTALSSGKAVAFSGFTVIITLIALLVPPLGFIRSIGIGAMIVIFVSVSVALTALPACLALLGPRVNALKLGRREPGERGHPFWRARARQIMRRPWLWAIGGTVLLILLGLPALKMQVADPGAKGLSLHTDARQVQLGLKHIGLAGILNSYNVLVDFGHPGGFYSPASIQKLAALTRDAKASPFVSGVYSAATTTVPQLLLYQFYGTPEIVKKSPLARLAAATVSTDGRYALLRVFPLESITPSEGSALQANLQSAITNLGLTARIGGAPVGQAEWTNVLYSSLPLAIGLVYLLTFILLGLAFRSLLIPLKAILLNTITVGAAFGIITLVFQYGLAAKLFGLTGALGFVDNSAPVFIFAILFGLSMDYEVFLVSRILEAHERGATDREAVAEALANTGGVISSAAAIMVVVFACFLFSEVVVIKTLGLGLSVAIFLDATLVRLALVPAVMSLAGHWNWWLPRPVAGLAEHAGASHD